MNLPLHPRYLEIDTAHFRRQFEQAKPFPYLALKDFLNEDFAQKVLQALQQQEFEHQESDLYSFGQTKDLALLSDPVLKKFHELLSSQAFKDHMMNLTGLSLKGGVDCSGFGYRSKDYLLPHDDRADTRKLAYTFNLTRDFSKKDGGALEFFSDATTVVSLPPVFNTLVIFIVEEGKTIHQVSEVVGDGERYALSGWFHDR